MGSPHWADALRGGGVPPCSVDHARCLAPRGLSGSSAVSRSPEVWSRDAQRCAVVVHESQAGGRLRGGLGDCGAFGALEPASAYPDDLGGHDTAEAMAGGRLLPLHGVAQEMAISPVHDGKAP